MIEGLEWLLVAILVIAFLVSAYLIASVQGDLYVSVERGESNDDQATAMFIDLLKQTRHNIIIHDDGDNSPGSMYNRQDVICAIKSQIEMYGNLRIKCLFNDEENLKILEIADGKYKVNFEIWYSKDHRPNDDIHYKIVDGGRLVHLSKHEHGAGESEYILRSVKTCFAHATRKRISEEYVSHFNAGVSRAKLRQISEPA